MLRSLDAFSGIGGFSLALQDVARPVAYCEIDADAVRILHQRMADGALPQAPVCPDVVKLDAAWLAQVGALEGPIELLTAGFPAS